METSEVFSDKLLVNKADRVYSQGQPCVLKLTRQPDQGRT